MHPAPVYFPISQTENTLNNFKLIFNRRSTAKTLRSSISKKDPATKKLHLKPSRSTVYLLVRPGPVPLFDPPGVGEPHHLQSVVTHRPLQLFLHLTLQYLGNVITVAQNQPVGQFLAHFCFLTLFRQKIILFIVSVFLIYVKRQLLKHQGRCLIASFEQCYKRNDFYCNDWIVAPKSMNLTILRYIRGMFRGKMNSRQFFKQILGYFLPGKL